LLRLGWLYADEPKKEEARATYERAVEWFRRRTAQEPNDVSARVGLGRALAETEQNQEAEATLRRCVQQAPDDWRTWLALGEILLFKEWSVLEEIGGRAGVGVGPALTGNMQKLAKKLREDETACRRLAECVRIGDEALECFHKAVAAGPNEADAYLK